ncbi:hypothetical protein FOCC_FOCC015113 [Frankliniella occidentalis]|nr:hypothetical protein FOCC_FOCC015113 [Frankliniella occidentalis]
MKLLILTVDKIPVQSITGLCVNVIVNNHNYALTLDGNRISWESRKQKLVAQSSTESEHIFITESVKECIYLNGLIDEIFRCGQQVTIFNDNKNVIGLGYSQGFNSRTKHLGVRLQLIRDCIKEGTLELEHLSTSLMPADMLTKGLTKPKLQKCRNTLKLSN